ncbi:LysM peptidoglycan-binding domain-containing protein [Bdellovibrio sp. HCB290]|uniref:LysM peptidoglycan-binding domain-containing protein n=1 Tax=Bdellovibrio sp. HCB290 TaxID=3394356 RepID=UPI0039B4DFCE
MRLETFWITFFVCFLTAGEAAWAITIDISAGDTLSAIAQRYKGETQRIYGKNGFLTQLLSLNPHVKNPHDISPGTTITLPENIKMTRMVSSEPKVEVQPKEQVCKSEDPLHEDVLFEAGIDFVYAKIDARDVASGASASYVSDLMNRYRLSLVMEIVPQLLWKTEFAVQKNKYLSPDATITVNDAPDTKRVEFSLQKFWDNGWKASLLAGVRQQIFIRRESASNYEWDLASIPFAGLGVDYDILKWRNHVLGVSGSISYLSKETSGVQEVQDGMQSEVDLWLVTRKKGLLLQQRVGFSYESQNSEIVEQQMTELLFGLSVGYAF